MVLSLHRTMPPTSTLPTIEESMAAMVENMSKLIASTSANTSKLLKIQTTISQLDIITKHIASQNIVLSNLVKTVAKIDNIVAIQTSPSTLQPPLLNPIDILSNVQPEDVIIHPKTIQPTNKLIEDKLASEEVRFSPSTQHPTTATHIIHNKKSWALLPSPPKQHMAVLIQRFSTTEIHTTCNRGLRSRYMKIIYSGHQCYPPKFVYLQPSHKPPWEPHNPWYNHMSLEDKARFKAWGIDTCMKKWSISI